MTLKLGYLDFGFLSPQRPVARKVLLECIELAERLETLGFDRYWIGEHHNEGTAFASPELLVPVLAGCTSTLRIGVGAVLLQYRSPLKVATDFQLIEALFPGRIDLGVGRGGADDARAHAALLDGRPARPPGPMDAEGYAAKCVLLDQLLQSSVPPDHPLHGVPVAPKFKGAPELWICGAESAGRIAAQRGAAFCLTLFHGRLTNGPSFVRQYLDAFVPNGASSTPRAAIAVAGVCAPSDDAAETIRAAWPHNIYLPTLVGTPQRWKEEVAAWRRAYGVDDILVLDISQTIEDRIRHSELLAEALLGG